MIKLNYQKYLFYFIFLYSFVLLSLTAFSPIQTYDGFWHLKMGSDLINHGLSPLIDHYSFTFNQQEIENVSVIYQASLALIVEQFDIVTGFQIYLLVMFFLFILALYLFCVQVKAHWFILLLIIPLIIYFIQLRPNPRPELLSNVLIIFSLILYFKVRDSFKTKDLMLMSALLLFWVNWHIPIFGFIIFFAFFVDKFIDKLFYHDSSFSWKKWSMWAAIIFLIGFINIDFKHVLFTLLSFFDSGWKSIVVEFQDTNKSYTGIPQFSILWILGTLVSVFFFKNRYYGPSIISLILIISSWHMVRLATPTAIIIFCLSIFALSHASAKDFYFNLSSASKNLIIILSSCLIFFNFIQAKDIAITQLKKIKPKQLESQFYPQDVINYMKKNKSGGNIYNEIGEGGYILYQLSPDFKVYWDGRINMLYPFEFVNKLVKANKSYPVLFRKIENLYSIDYIILKNNPKTYFIITENNRFKLDFIGEYYSLYSKDKNNLNFSSKLSLFPVCWNPQINQLIESKDNLSKIILGNNSRIKKFLNIINKYEKNQDKNAFFNKRYISTLTENSEKRLVAYMALKLERYDSAIYLFSNLTDQNNMDRLMLIESYAKNKQFKKAEDIISILLSKEKSNILKLKRLKPFEKAVMLTLIKQMKEKYQFNIGTETDIYRLKRSFNPKNFNYTLPLKSIFPEKGCIQLFPED